MRHAQGLALDGHDARAVLARRFRHELFGPRAECGNLWMRDDRELIASRVRERADRRTERDPACVFDVRGARVRLQRAQTPIQDRLDVVTGDRCRHHAEVGEGGVAAADVGIVFEDAPEAVVLGLFTELRAGIGDGDELLTGGIRADRFLHALVEIAEERFGFGRGAAFTGDDEERAGEIERVFERLDLRRIARIEHVQVRIAGDVAEGHAQDVGRKRTATHAEHDDVREIFGGLVRKALELGHAVRDGFRKVEPTQCVLDDRGVLRVARPRLRIMLPELGEKVVLREFCERCIDAGVGTRFTGSDRDAFVAARKLVLFALDRTEHRVIGVGERFDAVDLQLLRHIEK